MSRFDMRGVNKQHSSALLFWLKKVMHNQKKRLFIGVLLALLTAISAIGLLALSGWLITATAITGLAISVGGGVLLDIYRPGGGIRFFALSRTVGRYYERLHNHDVVLSVIAGFRGSLFAGLMQLPAQQLRHTRDSEWLSRLTADLDNLDSLVLRLLMPPLVAVGTVLLVAGLISFFWLKLGLIVATLTLLLGIVYFSVFTHQTSRVGALYSEQINQARMLTIDHLHGQLELQAAHQQRTHQTQLVTALSRLGRLQLTLNQHIANGQLIVNCCHGGLVMAVAVSVLMRYQHDLLSGPVAVMLVLAVFSLGEVLQILPIQLGHWGKTRYAAQRLQPLAEHTPISTQELPALAKLSLHLSACNKVNRSVEGPITFELFPAQSLLITGRSGSGKSTIANLLAGLDAGNYAQLLINEQPLHTSQLASWHQQITYLAQHNSILAGSLLSNLTLGHDVVDEHRIWQALKLVELDDWARQLPAGLNSWLGDTGNQLSGGQARRIGLVRLILKDAALIILDEPFNGIDNAMAQRIWSRLSALWKDKMLVVLMHERPDYYTQLDSQSAFFINLDN